MQSLDSLPKPFSLSGPALKVRKASEMGFCFGVRRAIGIIEKATQAGPIESLGAIVHNRQVVERLANHGVKVIRSLDELQGRAIAISSHGAGSQVLEKIRQRGLRLVDTTCPFVSRAQNAARKLARAGFSVVVFGDADHPEVRGVLDWAEGKGIATIEASAALSRLSARRLGILSQTTQSPIGFADFIKDIISLSLNDTLEIRIVNTICDATTGRQSAALELAGKADLMVVIGGRNSANTRRLAEVCADSGVETHHIETAIEIEPSWLTNRQCIGVTAGASTPDETIKEVVTKLEEMVRD